MNKRSGYTSFLTRSICSVLAALFILTSVAALLLVNFERQAFNPDIYKRLLVSQGFYGKFAPLLGTLLAGESSSIPDAFAGHLSAQQWTVLIQAVLPEGQLQAMAEDTLDQFFAYLNGETVSPHISLIPLKVGLESPAGLNAALAIIRSQPDCTVQEIMRILASFGGGLCNPQPAVLDLLQPVIQGQLKLAASAIPDGITFLTPKENTSLLSFRKDLDNLRLLMRLSPVLPITLLIALTLLGVRTLKSWLIWWGWSFLLTGLLGALLSFFGAPFFRLLIERWLSERITLSFPLEITSPLSMLAEVALRQILLPAAWEGLGLFMIGLTMIFIQTFLLKHNRSLVKFSPHS